MRKIGNVLYSERHKEKLDAYLPEKKGFKTVVYFHGGGIEAGDKADPFYVEIAERFAQNGYGFVSVNYRMYPQAKFPDFLEDAAESVAYVKNHAAEWGGNGEIIVSGQSAGAWMSLMLCFDAKYLNSVGIDPLEIKAWLIDSAQTTSHFNVLKYESGENPNLQRINEFAPQYFVRETSKFTKILLIFYENDMPCRYEQNMLFYKSVLAFDKDADISYQVLPGGHCHGSTEKDEDGEYAYVKTAMKWFQQKEL